MYFQPARQTSGFDSRSTSDQTFGTALRFDVISRFEVSRFDVADEGTSMAQTTSSVSGGISPNTQRRPLPRYIPFTPAMNSMIGTSPEVWRDGDLGGILDESMERHLRGQAPA
jgi:hypothetical protein